MKHILITGEPGVGKTTLVKKIIRNLSKSQMLFDGFITEEVRNERSHRTGFEVRLVKSNAVTMLADKNKNVSDQSVKHLGPYTVYVGNFEQLTLQLIASFENGILIVDEIGKMELFSNKFEQCVGMAFKKQNLRILATVPVRGSSFVQTIKRDNECQLFTIVESGYLFQVTQENRDALVNEISSLLIKSS